MDDLRALIKFKGLPMWKIADAIGISEPTLYRWMRTPDIEHRQKIMDGMKIVEGGENEQDKQGL